MRAHNSSLSALWQRGEDTSDSRSLLVPSICQLVNIYMITMPLALPALLSRAAFMAVRKKPGHMCSRQASVRATDSNKTPTDSPVSMTPVVKSGSVDCVGEGQSVVCTVPEGEGESIEGVVVSSDRTQPSDDGVSQPLEQSSSEDTLFAEALGLLLLISPFFFWGTAMVAMKLAAPHSTPLFTGACCFLTVESLELIVFSVAVFIHVALSVVLQVCHQPRVHYYS